MEKKPDEAVAVPAVTGGPREKRRRRYSAPEKLGLLAEAEAPGGSISLVSRIGGASPHGTSPTSAARIPDVATNAPITPAVNPNWSGVLQ